MEKHELVKISCEPDGGIGTVTYFGSDLISVVEDLAEVSRIEALRSVIRCSFFLNRLALIKSWGDGRGGRPRRSM